MIINGILDECVIIYKDNNGNSRIISADVGRLINDWMGDCNYVANNATPVVYATCFGKEVECETFGDYMEMICRINNNYKDVVG
jgi:hypothetical protein